MKENLKAVVDNLQQVVTQARVFNDPILNKDKRKKHSNEELAINATVAVLASHMNSIEFHLNNVESLMVGLEEFTNEQE